ncbi:MAG: hypothetical protein ACE5R4_01195 [Armatimonadota bacterium]
MRSSSTALALGVVLVVLAAALVLGQVGPDDSATVRLDVSQPQHQISRLVYGGNVVYFGMSCEEFGFLAPHLKQAGFTNLRLHTGSDPDYRWDTHTVREGSNPDNWGIYDNPLRDDNPFEKNKFLRKHIDPGNEVHADHYHRTDLRCCGLIVKRPEARSAYGEATLPEPIARGFARCDVRVESFDDIVPGDDMGWRFMVLKDEAGQPLVSASLSAEGQIAMHCTRGGAKTETSVRGLMKPGQWASVEVSFESRDGRIHSRLWVNGRGVGQGDVLGSAKVASAAFGAVDCAASGELRIDAGVVDTEAIGTEVDESRQYLRRVTFDRDPINTDDFLYFCRQIGAEPVLQLPLVNKPESWTADYCADWLEYCNGAATTRWGQERADRGHPEPYGVKYVETSNEPYYGDDWRDHSAEYVAAQREVIPKLKAVDPNVLCIVNTNYHNEEVFPPLKDLVDGVGMRHYYCEQRGKSDAQQLPWLLGATVAIRKDKRAAEGKDELACDLYADWPWLRATFGDRDVFFAQTEYDYWLRYQPDKLATLGCALYKAGMLYSMMKHNVLIAQTFYLPRPGTTTMAAYALVSGQFTPTEYGACRFVPADVTCAQTPFDRSWGERPEYNSYVMPVLTAAGSLAQDGRRLSVLLIHRGTAAPLSVQVTLADLAPRRYAGTVLTGPDVDAASATPEPLAVRRQADGFAVELPPLSLAVVQARR